jgi:hypothetical protein
VEVGSSAIAVAGERIYADGKGGDYGDRQTRGLLVARRLLG